MDSETIAAIATAPGRGGVAVVRISGPAAHRIARTLTGREVTAADAGKFFYATLRDERGARLDDALVLVFAAPHSYTGEDAVELQTHGGTITPRLVLQAALAAGARLARRGEFTLRAFLNGKLDLTQAEAVIDVVDAKTERAQREAAGRLGGAQHRTLEALYSDALALSSRLEHALDFNEDELPPDFAAQQTAAAADLASRLSRLIATAREGKMLRDGARVVLCGKPNAGKSSLMNALLGEARAIVSDRAGTTRDSIGEWMELGGWPLLLIDTAGLRQTSDAIEREGVRRSEVLIAEADLILDLSEEERDQLELRDLRRIYVRTKFDLHHCVAPNVCAVSVVTQEGLADLRRAIVSRLEYLAGKGAEGEAADVTERQRELLVRAQRELQNFDELDWVVAANAARRAADAIARTIGKVYSDDLLEAVFSRFCVGK